MADVKECRKHPGTKFETLSTSKGLSYVGCPTCKAEKQAAKAGEGTAIPTPAKKSAKKTAAKKRTALPAKKTATKQAPIKQVPPINAEKPRGGIFARFGMGRRGR